jgi:ABC-type Mn2+/Zn2+ transport system permease subunit
MKESIILYLPNILATALMGAILPAYGSHWIARRESARAVMISQLAGFGVLVGLIPKMFFGTESTLWFVAPTLLGIFIALGGGLAVNVFLNSESSKTAIFLSLFLLFWALSQTLLGFFPGIESHHTSIYFGDVVTLTRLDCLYFSVGASLAMVYFLLFAKRLKNRTFEIAVLRYPMRLKNPDDGIFFILAILLIVFSVQFLGVLFTLSCFLLPSTFAHLLKVRGVGSHIFGAVAAGFLASSFGFLLSIFDSRVLTTPIIVILLLFFSLAVKGFELAFFRCK